MVATTTLVAAIVAGGIGTYLIRVVPLASARRLVDVPPRFQRALQLIPPAVFASLVLPAAVRHGGELDLIGARPLVTVVAGMIGWRTRSVTWTLVSGLVLLTAFELL